MYGIAMYAIALMYPQHCSAAIAVQNGGLVVGSATDVMARVYILTINGGCTADGYVKRVDALRRIGAIMMIAEECVGIFYKDFQNCV